MNQHTPPTDLGCAPYESLVPLVALGEHEDPTTLAHIATCATCQQALADYATLRTILRHELSPNPVTPWPHPWATAPLTMEDVMNPHAENPPNLSRQPPPGRQSSRADALWKGMVAAVLLLAIGAVVLTHFAVSPAHVPATPTATRPPEPTIVSIPLLNVQPALQLAADQRLGGTTAGLGRLFAPTSGQAGIWLTTVDGKPITFEAYPADPRFAADGTAHVFVIVLYPPANQLGQVTYDPAKLEALMLSFLPADAHYIGEQTGSNVNATPFTTTGHGYISTQLAAIFGTHPDKVFFGKGTQSTTAGTLFWYCAPSRPGLSGPDSCFMGAGELA